MQSYEAMNEAVWEPGREAWSPALVWVRPETGRILVAARASYDYLAAHYRDLLDAARHRGFSELAIWTYWVAHGGNGYQTQRSEPYTVIAGDEGSAVNLALRAFVGEGQ